MEKQQDMACDVKINNNGKRFKFRVAGIVEHDGKVLMVRMNNNPLFCFTGGHVELLEETSKAIERELNEELFFKVEVKKLICIHENFFEDNNGKFHELCFYFTAKPKEENFVLEDKDHEELDKGYWVHHEYRWINKEDLRNFKAEPKLIIKTYLDGQDDLVHLVTDDIKR